MKIDIVSKDLFSLEDAARELGINRATLYRWIARNKVVMIKLGKTPVILKSEIERLQTIGAKRKYERHKPRTQAPKVLQPCSREETTPPPLPKVLMPFSQ